MKVFLQWNRFGDSCCREMIHFTGDCSSKLAHTHHPEEVMPHSWAKSRWNRPETFAFRGKTYWTTPKSHDMAPWNSFKAMASFCLR